MSYQPSHTNRRTFLKGAAAAAVACTLEETLVNAEPTTSAQPGKFVRVRPESVRIAPAAILAFLKGIEQKVGGLHSFMLLRHGKVAAEGWWAPYGPSHPHMLFSLSKSFTSTALGLAVAEGLLTVEDKVVSFFPDSLPEKVTDNLAAMSVKNLLTMNTGHDTDATGGTTSAPGGDWVKGFFALPVEHEPGSKFVYNSAATYMCSAIVQKRTGKTVLDYLKPRLFDPLGITGQTWESCPKGINVGGWGLSVKTEDIARFGQLYLQKGKWGDRQLIPESWVEEATTKQVSNGDPATGGDWNQGYGYQFWRCRHGHYRGDGAFGQFCIVMPALDAVLAITSGVGDMGAVMEAAWEHLLPGMSAAPLTASPADSEMKKRLSSLSVHAPEGKESSPKAQQVSGKTYRLEDNSDKIQTITLAFAGKQCKAFLQGENGEIKFSSGQDTWVKGMAPYGPNRTPGKVAARGAWTTDDTYVMRLCFYETPFVQTVVCKFDGDEITIDRKQNVSFGPTNLPSWKGRAA